MDKLPPWVVPGAFCICTQNAWKARSGIVDDMPAHPPRKGRVYTISGAIITASHLRLIALAEYPHHAFELDYFAPADANDAAWIRRMLVPNAMVDQADTIIEAATLGKRWVV